MNLIFDKILKRIQPSVLYKSRLEGFFLDNKFSMNDYENLYVLAVGKSASLEARHLMDYISQSTGRKIADYFIVTKKDHTVCEFQEKTFESSHPYVTEKSFLAARKCSEFLGRTTRKDLVFALISGGSSALLEQYSPEAETKLQTKFNQLVDSGINISDLNHLRKLFSHVKNMRLLKHAEATVFSFLSSDIPSKDPYLIGSSPTLRENISTEITSELISKYDMTEFSLVPEITDSRESDGFHTLISYENLKPVCRECFLGELNIRPVAYNDQLEEIWESYLAEIDVSKVNISYGELNINVRGNGLGGRNTHFVLFMADLVFAQNYFKLDDNALANFAIFSLGTDGGDGPTDAAGAWLTYETFQKADHTPYLLGFDSYHYFEITGTLIKSGPTGTNLMDVRGMGPIQNLTCQK